MRTSTIQPPLGTLLNMSHSLCQGLVASWLMNEGGGQKIFDGTGKSNIPGALTNGAVFKQSQKGSAISFDGVNDYIDAGNSLYLSPGTGNFSISVWIWAANANQYGIILQKRSAATFPLYTFSIDDNCDTPTVGKRVGFGVEGVTFATMARTVDTTSNIIDGNWHHIVVTWTVSGNVIKIYVDGISVALTPRTTNGTVTSSVTDTSLKIGSNTGSAAFFTGLIQNLKMWNRALSSTEVFQLYTNPYQMFQQSGKTIKK